MGCYNAITKLLSGGVILELGSGYGTKILSERYTMYSIEHNDSWLNKYDSTYIHAPIIDGWYDVDVLRNELPIGYDLILIDGPPTTISPQIRTGFLKNISLFNTDAIMVFDDVNRSSERWLTEQVSELVNRKLTIYGDNKQFAVI